MEFPLNAGNGFAKNSLGIKTKLDNANRFPIRQADTPVQKRFLNKAAEHFCLAALSFTAFSAAEPRLQWSRFPATVHPSILRVLVRSGF